MHQDELQPVIITHTICIALKCSIVAEHQQLLQAYRKNKLPLYNTIWLDQWAFAPLEDILFSAFPTSLPPHPHEMLSERPVKTGFRYCFIYI